jgi:hypothetical protein
MSAFRLPLLGAFVGGCLSGAVLLGVWQTDAGAPASVPAPKQRATDAKVVTAALIPTTAPAPAEAPVEASRAPAAHDAPPSADVEPPAPAGSAVSDILTDLETAYRRRLAKTAPEEAPVALAQQPPTPAVTNAAIAHAEPRREAATQVVAAVAPAPTVAPAVIAAVPTAAPAAIAPLAQVAIAPAAVVPVAAQAAAAPAAQADQRPTAVHIGDINNNTYVTNVRHGDVYLMQQQVAMLQYLQLLGVSSLAGRAGLAGVGLPVNTPVARGMAPQTPQYRQFPSTLTNPDNPWGFTFAPPNLVH